jgi:hypothetical protein
MFPKLLLFSAFFFFTAPATPFQGDVKRAVETLRTKKKLINQFANGLSTDENRSALSVVFPEVIRFNSFSDFIETKTLEWVYVDYGAEKADFSVGLFQMKPSFIEKLEEATKSDPSLFRPFADVLNYPSTLSAMEIRKTRVARMQNFETQIAYAQVFLLVCNTKFKEECFVNNPEKIKFFAAAYNFGFDKDVNDIKKWTTKKAFPYGVNYKGKQMIYSEVSADFYAKYAREFFE